MKIRDHRSPASAIRFKDLEKKAVFSLTAHEGPYYAKIWCRFSVGCENAIRLPTMCLEKVNEDAIVFQVDGELIITEHKEK